LIQRRRETGSLAPRPPKLPNNHKLKRGQIVVLDNLSAHKSPKVNELVESVGTRVLRLPPYSPDFNPIEMAISKMKSLLRKLGRRTVDDLHDAVGQGIKSITPDEARAFMQHCAYTATTECKPL